MRLRKEVKALVKHNSDLSRQLEAARAELKLKHEAVLRAEADIEPSQRLINSALMGILRLSAMVETATFKRPDGDKATLP